MITVESVQIKNLRAIGNAVFEPLPASEGSTALVGPNGVGKSSVLTGLLWALYGVTPDGVPVTAMRRQGTEIGVDDCFVLVQFRHDEQTVLVERGLKGSKDATYVKITVDGHETAFGKVKAAEAFITARLGLDAEGFLTAFVVRQKELDGLIKARPADRRRLIERLAGIDRMSDAVKASREEETSVKRRLDVMPGSEEAVTVAQAALDQATAQSETAAAALETASDALDAAAGDRAAAEQTVRDIQAQIEAARAHQDKVRGAEQAAAIAERDVQTATEAHQEAGRIAATFTPDALTAAYNERDALNERMRRVTTAADDVTRAEQGLAQAQQRHQQTQSRANAARVRAESAEQKAAATRHTLAGAPATAQQDLEAARAAHTRAAEAASDLRAERNRLTAAIQALQTAETAACPTCATTLPDPRALMDSLAATRSHIDEQGKRLVADATAAEERVRQAQGVVEKISHFRVVLDNETQAAAEAKVLAAEAASDVAATAAEVSAAESTLAAAQTAAEAALNERGALSEQMQALNATIRGLENARDQHDRLPALEAAVTRAQSTLTTARETIAAAGDAPPTPSTETAQRAQADLAEADARHRASQQEHHEADRAVQAARFTLDSARRDLHTEQEKVRARAELLVEYEAKAAVRSALDAFRKDRIARIAPELSEVATDFVSRMTDGKFVAVDLDEEFTPFVTDADGNQRPAAWLSGGEESAVALALRVAIGELIAGQRGGLLWLDEVLTAQDSARRPAMMRAISELPGRQVITINHAAEATDMVDRVLEVLPSPEGSTIVAAVEISPVSEDAVLA